MKTTILYIHDSTACWMQWRGKQLLQVFCESITREMAPDAAKVSRKEDMCTLCPWLSAHSQQVRLLIDPVVDQTKPIPAYDHDFSESHGVFSRLRQLSEQIYLTCRSLTSDVLADDLTRYRHDRLMEHPNALMQWHAHAHMKNTYAGGSKICVTPAHWLITDSGISDHAIKWLHALADNGLGFLEVRAVSALFAIEDAKELGVVITVWVQPARVRLIHCQSGSINKVEQWGNDIEARIALGEIITSMSDEKLDVSVRFIGDEEARVIWQEAIPSLEIQHRGDGVFPVFAHATPVNDELPEACRNLPVWALVQLRSKGKFGVWPGPVKWDAGSAIRSLLSVARWRRCYKQSLIATTVAAAYSGYFVLLACMHASEFVELHGRANTELKLLNKRRSVIETAAVNIHEEPQIALQSIERLLMLEAKSVQNDEVFLLSLSKMLQSQPQITLKSVSWRPSSFIDWDEKSVPLSTVLARLPELTDTVSTADIPKHKPITERLVLISGDVSRVGEKVLTKQQVSESLLGFFQALTDVDKVIDIVPMTDTYSSTLRMNLPSDVSFSGDSESKFVVAVRVSV